MRRWSPLIGHSLASGERPRTGAATFLVEAPTSGGCSGSTYSGQLKSGVKNNVAFAVDAAACAELFGCVAPLACGVIAAAVMLPIGCVLSTAVVYEPRSLAVLPIGCVLSTAGACNCGPAACAVTG